MILDVLLTSLINVAGTGATMGNEAGNGGDVVICPNGTHAPTLSVLDYFEARIMMPQIPLDLIGQDRSELVERALLRLERLDPARANRYRREAEEILTPAQSTFLSGIQLRDIADSGYVPLGDCKIRQAVIQKEPWHPRDRRYTFDEDVFVSLSPADQAGLILHEVIYREVLELGQRNSSAVRQLVAWLSSPLFDQVTTEQYADIEDAIFFIPKMLAFNQERITLYAQRGQQSVFELAPYLASSETSELMWRLADRSPADLNIDPRKGILKAWLHENSNESVLRTSVTVTSGVLWDVVPVDVIPIRENRYPPRWLADEFEIPVSSAAIKKTFDLAYLIGVEANESLKFRMISGPQNIHVSGDGILTVEAGFEGKGRIEVAVHNESGWAQTSFIVGREQI